MDAQILRAAQAPLKRRYREDPAEALERLGALTGRYCVVGQSLRTPPRLVLRRVEASR
jgi:hypothetical protein